MIVDDVTIRAIAGAGGKGMVAFNKTKMSLGPVGGNGGKGGSIYIEGVSDLAALNKFRFKKEVKAENGQDGHSQLRDGRDGKDLILTVPVGTVAHNLTLRRHAPTFQGWGIRVASPKGLSLSVSPEEQVPMLRHRGLEGLTTGQYVELTKIGQRVQIALGGRGGKGNFNFRASANTTPKEFEYGEPGESFEVRFELKMIADVGFVGLPNVGKSSLLNEVTRAKSKVANYPFTTLEPNLGVYYDLVLADIPGIIEGASKGKGLGIKFLRHIERTKIIFHFVAADSVDPVLDYKTVRSELGAYNKLLLEKPEYLFISKKDAVSSDIVAEAAEKLKELHKNATPISIFDWDSIELVRKILNDLILEKTEEKTK